ncbi:MAG: hypothetical protein WC758_07960 [Candidatus Woesearchaeota archaeon]|jgi:hypothetical protein
MIKEKTIEEKFDKLLKYITKADRELALDYFERCLELEKENKKEIENIRK